MFYESEYMISVETDANLPMEELRDALQEACDGGAEFQFQIITTRAPSFVVLFIRDVPADEEMIAERMLGEGEHARKHAVFLQLADELDEDGIEILEDLSKRLKAGDAQLMDFGNLEHIRKKQKLKFHRVPAVVNNVMNGLGGLYMEIVRPHDISIDQYAGELADVASRFGYHSDRDTTVGPPCEHGISTSTHAVWFHSKKAG